MAPAAQGVAGTTPDSRGPPAIRAPWAHAHQGRGPEKHGPRRGPPGWVRKGERGKTEGRESAGGCGVPSASGALWVWSKDKAWWTLYKRRIIFIS